MIRSSGVPARDAIAQSEYWQFRDRQFGYSQFLDGAIPEVDPRVDKFIALRSEKIHAHEDVEVHADACGH